MGEEMREALETAVDSIESGETVSDPMSLPPKEDDDSTPESPTETPSKGDGEPEPTSEPPAEDPPAEDPPAEDPDITPTPEGEPVADPAPTDKVAEKLAKAPVNWNPAAREGWKELPEEVRAQIHKRETEMNRSHMAGSENRKAGEEFNALAGRYSAIFAAEGIQSPLEGFERVLQTMATLRMGSTEQKAMQIANFIKAYDIDIAALDDLLVGRKPGAGNGAQPPVSAQLTQMLDERMQPVNDLLNRIQTADANNASRIEENASVDVNAFGEGKEFFEDVRMDMGDLMDMAAQREQTMSLDQAYKKACALSPEISQILTTREAQTSLPNKLEAASSIRGKKSGSGAPPGDLSMRATIEQLWDAPPE